jgi:hypothetical protein
MKGKTTMKRNWSVTTFAFSLVLCWAFSSSVSAQCLFSFKHGGAAFAASPMTARKAKTTVSPRRDDGTSQPHENGEVKSITGLWDVQFISDGQVVDEGFDQYHFDGTEILNDTPPPSVGNVCLGVWAKTGAQTLKLKHPSWIYDPTNTFVIGTATIFEAITLDDSGDSFAGTFTVQIRDLSGNPLGPDLAGDLKGERIAVD